MSQSTSESEKRLGLTSHNIFARVYERLSSGLAESNFMAPLRREMVGKASGLVLEIGAGTGLNFAFYQPGQVERVEATEPDTAMLRYARERLNTAKVPITLTQAAAEALPFADATFDSVVATLVFCSVTDPVQGLREIRRVLKPGGVARIGVPDGRRYAESYVGDPRGFLESIRPGRPTPLLAMQEVFYLEGHRAMYDAETLTLLCAACGFVSAKESPFGDGRMWLNPDSEHRRLETLYVEAVK